MFSLNFIPAVALALLCLTDASPISSPNTTPATVKLLKRYNSVVNCDNDLPNKDPANGLNTQADLIGRASADMATLANTAWQELNTNGAGSPAFQHYFLERDLDLTKRLFSAIAENNDPTNSPYDFVIDCTKKSQCDSPTRPYAFTDFRPESGGPPTMTICPSFFDAGYANNDGLLPYDPNNDDQKTRWCVSEHDDAITNSYRSFITPGHTLLHEVTHLDKVGAFLENGLDNVGGHGTFDYINLDGNDPSVDDPGTDVLWQARQLQLLFAQNADRTDTTDNANQRVAPIRNAESFAGCGTESFFMKFCGVSYIAPETGVGPDDDGDDPEDAPEWTPPK